MDKFLVEGPVTLKGEVHVSGAKNSALPLMFSTLLADGTHRFSNVPELFDIQSAISLLNTLQAECNPDWKHHTLEVRVSPSLTQHAEYDLVRKMRASILCLGPLLTRYGHAKVSLPGGCAIGSRPIDLHLEGLKQMGATIELEAGYVIARAKRLQGARILFEKATVGGTENLLMAAALAKGETLLENAAKEPEVVDLCHYLQKMGAKIDGLGSSVLRIQGVDQLEASQHRVIPDRIEAGTLLIAAAITNGHVRVCDLAVQDLDSLLQKLKEAEVPFQIRGDSIVEILPRLGALKSVDITTAPHPLFPTDLQAQFMALMTQAQGTSVISESVFENRFMHVQELNRLGADVVPKSSVAVVRGPARLKAAPVMATDLRASASLVLAALVAEGRTEIKRIYHLDRGYERLENKLKALGANVSRQKE